MVELPHVTLDFVLTCCWDFSPCMVCGSLFWYSNEHRGYLEWERIKFLKLARQQKNLEHKRDADFEELVTCQHFRFIFLPLLIFPYLITIFKLNNTPEILEQYVRLCVTGTDTWGTLLLSLSK